MDQSIDLKNSDRQHSIERLSRYLADSVDTAGYSEQPFPHLVFERVFPDEIYAAILEAMPMTGDYRPVSGRARENDAPDGTHTRVKIDLFPECIRALPAEKRKLWEIIGGALCSDAVKAALVRRLAKPLEARFGRNFARVGLYPLPVLTRDIPGYRIPPHPDTHWKAITVQLYLPRDASAPHIGTIFLKRHQDGSMHKHTKMSFTPNTGYAFAVSNDSWHSVDPVGPEVTTRDSILLAYFVDQGLLRVLRNRARRIGNFLLNETRAVVAQ